MQKIIMFFSFLLAFVLGCSRDQESIDLKNPEVVITEPRTGGFKKPGERMDCTFSVERLDNSQAIYHDDKNATVIAILSEGVDKETVIREQNIIYNGLGKYRFDFKMPSKSGDYNLKIKFISHHDIKSKVSSITSYSDKLKITAKD